MDKIALRREALAEQEERYNELRRVHMGIANQLSVPLSEEAVALLDDARHLIQIWENKGTCSRIYVRAWRRILRDPEKRLRSLLNGPRETGDAMLQNSPFRPRTRMR